MFNTANVHQPSADSSKNTVTGTARVPRVIVCECRQVSDVPMHRLVQDQSWVTVAVNDASTLLSMLTQHGADVLVMGLCVESGEQIGILRLARRILPGIPLIVVATSTSDITEAQIRALDIAWYGVTPLNPGDLKQAVHSAVLNRPRSAYLKAAPGGTPNDRPTGRKAKGDL